MLAEPFSACVRASLACIIALIFLKDVLCYLSSSRNSNPKDFIIKCDVSFYDEDAIIRAKDGIFKLCIEKT